MSKKPDLKAMGFATKAIHGGHTANTAGALVMPIYQASTFTFESAEQGGRRFALEEEGYIYTRLGNPNSTQLEEKIVQLRVSRRVLIQLVERIEKERSSLMEYMEKERQYLKKQNARYARLLMEKNKKLFDIQGN